MKIISKTIISRTITSKTITSKTLALASVLALTVPNMANARGFEHSSISALTTAVKIEIVYSEDMQNRANALPEKISSRNSGIGTSARSGFAQNGFYGDKALTQLSASLEKKLTKKFTKKGISISDDAPVTMRITIEDAKNNRPTFRQLSEQPSLSFQSFAVGGAEVSADFVSASGESLGTMKYSYYDSSFELEFSQRGPIWFDAKRSFDFFASKAAKTLAPKSSRKS